MTLNQLAILPVLLLGFCSTAAAGKSTTATRVIEPPVIDGILDESVWSEAARVDDLSQVTPVEFAEPSEKTELFLLYDADALYIGLRAFDSNPERITAKVLRQGSGLRGEDRLKIVLSPFNDQRSGYAFLLNPNGVRLEAIYKDNDFDSDWTGIWQGQSKIDETGWTAEFRIPFKSLSFNTDEDWGINFSRDIVRKGEEVAWVSRDQTVNPSVVGTLSGLTDLSQGRGLDIVPSVSSTYAKVETTGASTSDTDPSLDIFYKVTPSLNTSLTFNTDFSATEVDNRQVNLTRFGLFFPEKRAFFLRESDIFEFGGIAGDNNSTSSRADRENGRPYFSRRIGLSESGQPVDLDVGAKLSGRMGRWNIGLQGIHQAEFESVDATDILVARISANVFDESTLGFIVTSGDPQTNLDNSVIGFDYLYRNSRLNDGRRVQADFWYQQSDTTGLSGDNSAYGLSVSAPNNTGLRGGATLKVIQQNFNPAVGFISRAGIEQLSADVGYTYRHNGDLLRSVFVGLDAQRIDMMNGDLQSQSIALTALKLVSSVEDQISISLTSEKENLLEPFEISEGVFIPAGTYSFDAPKVSFETAEFRPVDFEFSYKDGDFFSGSIRSLQGELGWRPSKHFRIRASYRFDDVDLPQGSFITRLASAQFEIAFSSTLSWVNLVQYDNVSDSIGLNSRVHWTPSAGKNLYLVVNRNYQEDITGSSFSPVNTDLTIKADYTFRF